MANMSLGLETVLKVSFKITTAVGLVGMGRRAACRPGQRLQIDVGMCSSFALDTRARHSGKRVACYPHRSALSVVVSGARVLRRQWHFDNGVPRAITALLRKEDVDSTARQCLWLADDQPHRGEA